MSLLLIKGVKKTFELCMTIAEEELLDKDFDWWTDGLIKYRKDGWGAGPGGSLNPAVRTELLNVGQFPPPAFES